MGRCPPAGQTAISTSWASAKEAGVSSLFATSLMARRGTPKAAHALATPCASISSQYVPSAACLSISSTCCVHTSLDPTLPSCTAGARPGVVGHGGSAACSAAALALVPHVTRRDGRCHCAR